MPSNITNTEQSMSFKDKITNLFRNNVVVKRIGDDSLKVKDFGAAFSRDRNKRPYRSKRLKGLGSQDFMYSNKYIRINLYNEYDLMDRDSIIGSALDILADECTVKNEQDEIINVKTSHPEIKNIIEDLFYNVLDLDFNLWSWIRETCKYGDHFIELHVVESRGVTGFRILEPQYTTRIEEYDYDDKNKVNIDDITVSFNYSGDSIRKVDRLENSEVLHFRMLADTGFLPYGKSLIEGARKEWQRLNMMEDAMLIQRIMRAPERRIIYVDIGNMEPNDVDSHMEQVISEMKKTPYYDPATGDYNLRFNMENALEDIYMPVRGGDSGDRIDTLQGLQSFDIEDVDYFKDKMIASLKVPKAFLNYTEDMSGKATLAAEDIRFARTIERIQRTIVSELYKAAMIHLYSLGYTGKELVDFELSLNNPSTISEREKIELLNSKIALARDMKDSKVFDSSWIYKNIFKLSAEEINVIRHNLKLDAKNESIIEQIADPMSNESQYNGEYDDANSNNSEESEEVDDENNDTDNDFYDRSSTEDDPLGAEERLKGQERPVGFSNKFKGSSPLAIEKLMKKHKPSVIY